MKDDSVDYTIFFRRLCDFDSTDVNNNSAIRDIFINANNLIFGRKVTNND